MVRLPWVLLFLLGLALPAQKFVVENVATEPQRSWVFLGLPDPAVPKLPGVTSPPSDNSMGWLFQPVAHGVWVLADLPASTRAVVELLPPDAVDADVDVAADRAGRFELHRAIADLGFVGTTPSFWCKSQDGQTVWTSNVPQFWPAGGPRPSKAFIRLLEDDAAHQLWHLRTRIEGANLTIDWWSRLGSTCSTIEWTMRASYGTVQPNDGPLFRDLGEFGMTIGAEPTVDFARRVNVPAAERTPTGWRQLLMRPLPWGRASRVEWRGALLAADDPARRQGRPLGAVYAGWDGSWLVLGATPKAYAGAAALSASRRATYLNPPAGNIYDQRPACQPKVSGTTGEQPDFGCASGEEVVTQLSCWAIHDLIYHAQSYALRPTHNVEVNGDPIRAVDHPGAKTIGLRPDDRFSDADPLGWYWPANTGTIPYSWPGSGYTSPDDQHRSDGILHALYALTRDPALRETIEDQIELQKLGYVRPGSHGPGAPRAFGRVLLSNCNQLWLGFTDAKQFIASALQAAKGGMWASVPANAQIRTLGGTEEAKYGWLFADGSKIYGWQGWQETIAAIGSLAAYRVTGDVAWRNLTLMLSRTCTDWCFYRWQQESGFRHTYAQRWRSEAPGEAHPASSYYPTQPNYDIFTDGACARWTFCAPRMLLLLTDAMDPSWAKATALASGQPQNWFDSRWWAVR